MAVEGVLVVDKPQGPTSHDVVAIARRALREKRIGHTGTLDPLATGVLPLACGRATRLVRFLTASDKEYEATIRFGLTTDTDDVTGVETSRSGGEPSAASIEHALGSLRGEYLQVPPAYSAKKVAGTRAYAIARAGGEVDLMPVPVRVDHATLLAYDGPSARIALRCSAGFYVRAFARSLGERLGTGACLQALRRTRSGQFGLEQAVGLDKLAADGTAAAVHLVPTDGLLVGMPAVRVTGEGRSFVTHGRALGPAQIESGAAGADDDASVPTARAGGWIRVLDQDGRLVAVAQAAASGALQPSIVLI